MPRATPTSDGGSPTAATTACSRISRVRLRCAPRSRRMRASFRTARSSTIGWSNTPQDNFVLSTEFMKVVVATHNPGKLRELEAILAADTELVSHAALGLPEA